MLVGGYPRSRSITRIKRISGSRSVSSISFNCEFPLSVLVDTVLGYVLSSKVEQIICLFDHLRWDVLYFHVYSLHILSNRAHTGDCCF